MKKILEFLIKSFIENPNALNIEEVREEHGTIFYVNADDKDVGLIIGKGGRIIKAIRNILRIAGVKRGVNFRIELKNNRPPQNPLKI